MLAGYREKAALFCRAQQPALAYLHDTNFPATTPAASGPLYTTFFHLKISASPIDLGFFFVACDQKFKKDALTHKM